MSADGSSLAIGAYSNNGTAIKNPRSYKELNGTTDTKRSYIDGNVVT